MWQYNYNHDYLAHKKQYKYVDKVKTKSGKWRYIYSAKNYVSNLKKATQIAQLEVDRKKNEKLLNKSQKETDKLQKQRDYQKTHDEVDAAHYHAKALEYDAKAKNGGLFMTDSRKEKYAQKAKDAEAKAKTYDARIAKTKSDLAKSQKITATYSKSVKDLNNSLTNLNAKKVSEVIDRNKKFKLTLMHW